jgi:hypothetical protein
VNPLLAELGKQLTAKAAALLLAPGTLYVAAVVLAVVLGHADALDVAALRAWLDALAEAPENAALTLVVSAALLTASAVAALTASAAALLVRRTWATDVSPAPGWVGRLGARRRRRWTRASQQVDRLVTLLARDPADPAVREQLRRVINARDGLALAVPQHATWAGDRLAAVDTRVHRAYGLDLAVAWPRLWLVLPETARSELAAAQQRCGAAALLAGWALLYAPIALWWWPAALIAAGLAIVARARIRQAVDIYAELAESAFDLHGRDLLRQLGQDGSGPVTPAEGTAASSRMRKDATDRPDPI